METKTDIGNRKKLALFVLNKSIYLSSALPRKQVQGKNPNTQSTISLIYEHTIDQPNKLISHHEGYAVTALKMMPYDKKT